MNISNIVLHRLSVPLPRAVRTSIHNHTHADTVVVDMRVASGETEYGSLAMKRHLDLRVADVLMPDLQRMGGITEYRRAAELCRAYHQPVSSHLFMEASAHVLAAAPNALILEHMDWWQPLFTEALRLEEGCVVLSENPGIGLDLDRKALDRFKA